MRLIPRRKKNLMNQVIGSIPASPTVEICCYEACVAISSHFGSGRKLRNDDDDDSESSDGE